MEHIQNTDMHASLPFGSFKYTIVDCEQASYHKKWWRIDLPRVPAHQNIKYKIFPERRCENVL